MTRHINATIRRGLLFSVFFIACVCRRTACIRRRKESIEGLHNGADSVAGGNAMHQKRGEELLANQACAQSVVSWLGTEMLHREGDSFSNCEDLGRLAGPETRYHVR